MPKHSRSNRSCQEIVDTKSLQQKILEKVEYIHDYPKPGIIFQNIGPVLADVDIINRIMLEVLDISRNYTRVVLDENGTPRTEIVQIDGVAGLDSRGYLLAGMLGFVLNAGVLRIAKQSAKIGSETIESEPYIKEYGGAGDIFKIEPKLFAGKTIILVDDIYATGESMAAAIKLVKKAGGNPLFCLTLLDVPELREKAKENLKDIDLYVLAPARVGEPTLT